MLFSLGPRMLLEETVPSGPQNQQTEKSITQICASYDLGGGVSLGGSFVIYSVATPLKPSSNIRGSSKLYTELQRAASCVAEVIPVYLSSGPGMRTKFISLPYPNQNNHAQQRKETKRANPVVGSPPWFLINAAISPRHCIAGQNSVVETLLTILQRPWCVLEVCCCDIRTVAAVYKFAVAAEKRVDSNSRTYGAAVRLLGHELRKRGINANNEKPEDSSTHPLPLSLECPSSELWNDDSVRIPSTMFTRIRETYGDLAINNGLRSHNPFWLCLISVCAVYLGISCSSFAKTLHRDTRLKKLTEGCSEENIAIQKRQWGTSPSNVRLERCASENSLLYHVARCRHSFDTNALSPSLMELRHDYEYHRRLISLYRLIMWRLRESVP